MKSLKIFDKMDKIIPSDHMVLLYDEKDVELNINIIVAYITSRINRNEKCFFIKGDIDSNLILKKLDEHIDLSKSIDNGIFVILDKSEAYSKTGKFEARKMIDLLKELSREAIKEGYSGIGITGEISWVLQYEDGFDRIMNYEYLLNEEIFSEFPVSAICRYNINAFSNEMIRNIIEVHPIIIYNGEIHENPFYFDLVDSENVDIEKFHVKAMLNRIEEFSLVKSRFTIELKTKEKEYQDLQLSTLSNMVSTLVGLLELHDEYTKNHSNNVARYARKIAIAMELSEYEISQIYYAGLVHDIGKALIPKEVLNKKGKLTDEEYELVKQHPTTAYKALIHSEALNNIANIVIQHHERWDGKGYPNRIKGNNIELGARILAIADTYDAMTSNRPYRKAFSKYIAINEINEQSGFQFDPEIVDIALMKVFKDY